MSVIAARGLTKYFGSKAALCDVSFEVPQGAICGLLGRNGAGKTTAIKMLLGLQWPTRGSAELLGCDCTELTPQVRGRVGYVTEGHRLPRWMRISRLARFQRAFFPGTWDDRLFAEMIDYFGLSPRQKIKHLSNGQRAQVSLALTLAPNPELLIMDDPTLGLDPAVRREFLQGMIHLIMREGRTVLFSSHMLNDVERVADRILVLDGGHLRADCTLTEFRDAVLRFAVEFDGDVPQAPALDFALNYRLGETAIAVSVLKAEEDELRRWAEQAGAAEVRPLALGLEEQFIEFTEPPGRRRRLFSWETD